MYHITIRKHDKISATACQVPQVIISVKLQEVKLINFSIQNDEKESILKERIKEVAKRASDNPALKKGAESLRPSLSIWGLLGILFFFILPEIIGFLWGKEIIEWAHAHTATEPTEMGRKTYWLLEKLFEDGGSWVNMGIGLALLGWLARDFYRHRYPNESKLSSEEDLQDEQSQ